MSDADLQAIIYAAVRAASASARHSYSIIVTRDPDLVGKAPVGLVFCVDYTLLAATADRLGLPQRFCFQLILPQLGYQDGRKSGGNGRWAGAALLHQDRYEAATPEELDQMISAYGDPKQRLGLKDSFTEDHYFEWFFNAWANPVLKGQIAIRKRLVASGFLPPDGEETVA